MTREQEWEVPLMKAGGVFVKMNRVTAVDSLRALNMSKNDEVIFLFALFSEICRFDGQKWTMQQLMDLDPEDFGIINKEFNFRRGKK